jgi:tetratricopeptide (TPR) repeat protein
MTKAAVISNPSIMAKKSRTIPFVLSAACAALMLFSAGCGDGPPVSEARNYVYRSDVFYKRAAAIYRSIKGPQARLELGSLYFSRGEYEQAAAELSGLDFPEAQRMLAMSYFRSGDFTGALEIFKKNPGGGGEYLYYYGRTCEKLNLFDDALSVYRKIKSGKFLSLASERIESIVKSSGPGTAGGEMRALISSSGGQAEYPEAGALILFARESVEITADNREVSDCHYAVKILNQRGKEDFSEAKIEYDSTYEKVELGFARVIKPDGSMVEVGGRHLRDVSKYLNFPLYSNARVLIISFPELGEGAVIEYKFRIVRNELLAGKEFVSHYPVKSSEPILHADFSLRLSPGKEARIKLLNEKFNDFGARLAPSVERDKDAIVYKWSFRSVPQIIPEPQMPPSPEINPSILISSFSSWREIYDWWDSLSRDKIASDGPVRRKVKELLYKCRSEEEKARAIYNYCAGQIRYVAVEYGRAGYEPHNAGDIFRNKYGDCKDQAVLLVTMLREAGLKAWPVLIPTQDTYNLNPDFPAVIFDHCIAAVELSSGLVFMDPTAETCSFGDLPTGDQARRVLIFRPEGYEISETPLFPPGHNLLVQELKISPQKQYGISALRKVTAGGVYGQGQRYWLQYTQPDMIKQSLTQRIQEIAVGAELEGYDISGLANLDIPVALSYSFRGGDYFIPAGDLRILPGMAYADTSLTARGKRIYDIEFDMLDRRESVQEIVLPAGWKIRYLPGSFSEESPWLRVDVEYSLKGNSLVFRQKTEIKRRRISAAEYENFREFSRRLALKTKERVVLEKEKR